MEGGAAGRYGILFEPVTIGPKVAPNRFYQVPFSTGFGLERPRAQAHFRGTRAEGGWGVVCVELCSIAPESDRAPLPVPARLWDDRDAESLALVCNEIHRYGSLAGVELWYGGANVDLPPSRLVPGGPSCLPAEQFPFTYPRELSIDEIGLLQKEYVRAAIAAADSGMDIVYVYGAHGYLPLQFLSPYSNQRTDRYGGCLENRARFWTETLAAVQAAIGARCAVAVRIGIDPDARTGPGIEDVLNFVRLADHLVDLWDVNTSVASKPWVDMTPSRIPATGERSDLTGRLREVTAKPIVAVDRLTDPDQMVAMIASGKWDLVGAARPAIADPFLPRKVRDGRAADIRACIGCNVCISRITTGYGIGCTQNPTAGEEYRRGWRPEDVRSAGADDDRVLVVGGGIAGMECAVTLGRAGIDTLLVEGDGVLGGYARKLAALPGMSEWRRLVSYRVRQLNELTSVRVELNVTASLESVLAEDAGVVVLATGASWRADGLSHLTHRPLAGADKHQVLVPEAVLAGAVPRGNDLLVYDCEGHHLGIGIAEAIASTRSEVRLRFVTPYAAPAPMLERTFEAQWIRERLRSLGVEVFASSQLESIETESCLVSTFGERHELPTTGVVLITARVPNDALYEALVADARASKQVYRIGDCASPRHLAECVFDGHRVARLIAGEDAVLIRDSR